MRRLVERRGTCDIRQSPTTAEQCGAPHPVWHTSVMSEYRRHHFVPEFLPQYSVRLGTIPPKFDNEIHRYRIARGLTQEVLARELRVRVATISAWERGLTCPMVPIIFRLARLLATSAEGLYPEF